MENILNNAQEEMQQNMLQLMQQMIHDSITPLRNQINQQQNTIDSLETEVSLSSCGLTTVSDVDGNVYHTLRIGNQCWMKENLRTTRYADGTSIASSSNTSSTTAYRYAPNNDNSNSNIETYGYLYNWKAVMGNSSSSDANPSGVQGICPTGWHVPSDAEWTQFTDYVSSQSQYQCNNISENIAKSIASSTGWDASASTCRVGDNLSGNNATGFSVFPAGAYYGAAGYFGTTALLWSATEYNSGFAHVRILYNYKTVVESNNYNKQWGLSVRCLRD